MNKLSKEQAKEWLKTITTALIISALIIIFARPSAIIGASMEPTLNGGNLVLVEKVSKLSHTLKRGDIIVARTELPLFLFIKKNVIKRIIGLPGDSIEIKANQVFVNGQLLTEPYIKAGMTNGTFFGTVPEDHYFIMGDNRLVSSDSRNPEIGFIDQQQIEGKVYLRLFPFNEIVWF